MKLAVGGDHAGFPLKGPVIELLKSWGHVVEDFGTHSEEPVDFPDVAHRVCEAVRDGRAERAILVCGTGVGAAIAGNKHPGIRAAVCHDTYSAHQGVEHDDMNVLTLGARVIGPEPAYECTLAFLGARFSGEPRHRRRLDQVLAMEAAAAANPGT